MCICHLFRASNLCEHHTKAVFDLQLMVGRGEHKGVVDKSGFSAYRVHVGWGLNFLSVFFILSHRYVALDRGSYELTHVGLGEYIWFKPHWSRVITKTHSSIVTVLL